MESELKNTDIIALWHASRLKLTDVFENDVIVLLINNSAIGTFGNFSATIGKAKSKKTFRVIAIVACVISGTKILNYTSNLPSNKKKVLYIDTEQGRFHCRKVMDRIQKLAAISTDKFDEQVDFLSLRSHSTPNRIKIIEAAIKNTPELGFVVIDGIRDLAYDINSPSEATILISLLMTWSEEYSIHIHIVLHQNKGDNNARGHLGTELNNKAESVLQVARDTNNDEISIVSPVYIRDKDFENFAFLIDSNGLPELVDDFENGDLKSARGIDFIEILESNHRVALEKIFESKTELKYGELIDLLKKNYLTIGYDFGMNKIKGLLTFLKNKKMIIQEKQIYTYNPNFYY